MDWLVQLAGAGIVLVVLGDVYLTVLYPRSGSSYITMPLGKGMWRLFRLAARLRGIKSDRLFSFCGPTLLMAIALVWVLLLCVGFALIFWTGLGTGIQATQPPTATDFITAFYYSGYSLTTLGIGPLLPTTGVYKLLTVLEAALGFAIFTLTLTHFLSVYSALTRRNTFALSLYHRVGGKTNAAEMIARLGANGDFQNARQEIAQMAEDLLNLLESHHSYPVLHYFRFQEVYYSFAQISFINMDTATLLKSAIAQEQYCSLVNSAAVTQLESGSLQMLHQISNSFLPEKYSTHASQKHRETEWRKWYYRAVKRLQAEGIETATDLEAGADHYVSLRRQWDHCVVAFADYMAYRWSEIAPAEA